MNRKELINDVKNVIIMDNYESADNFVNVLESKMNDLEEIKAKLDEKIFNDIYSEADREDVKVLIETTYELSDMINKCSMLKHVLAQSNNPKVLTK